MIPWVWIVTVPFNFTLVYLYNRFLPKVGPLKMAVGTALAVMGVNIATVSLLPHFPAFIFFYYVWKDLYILFMFKQLWSMIHATIPASRSQYLYGITFGMGMLGSIVGSVCASLFAVDIGSENLFLVTIPLYAIWIFFFIKAMRYAEESGVCFTKEWSSKPSSFNQRIVSILILVVLMQFAVALIEYQFNSHLELNIQEKDLRTEYCGRVFGLTSLLSGALQFLGSFLLVRWIGPQRSHFVIPALLLANAVVGWFIPTFSWITFSFIFVKSIDFSLFGVLKEMLYIPLKLDEKYRAKAFIDVFAYRSSKAVLSLVILGLQYWVANQLLELSALISIFLFAFWFLFVVLFLQLDEKKLIEQ